MYKCKICDFETCRLANLERHNNRKTPCQPVENVVPILEKVLPHPEDMTVPNVGNDFVCETCGKCFANRQNEHRHKKSGKCIPGEVSEENTSPPTASVSYDASAVISAVKVNTCAYCKNTFSRADCLNRHLPKCGLKQLYEAGTVNITKNNNNNTYTYATADNSTHNHNSTKNDVAIVYKSYDKPFIDHIDSEMVKKLYLGNERNLKKMMKECVKRIWQDIPENNCFKLPFHGKRKDPLQPCDIIRVYCDGEVQLFPVHHVINVILQKCAHVCERYLRQHYYEETIPGRACLMHANVLEELALEPQEVWENDHKNRSAYHPFVKSALLECILIDIH